MKARLFLKNILLSHLPAPSFLPYLLHFMILVLFLSLYNLMILMSGHSYFILFLDIRMQCVKHSSNKTHQFFYSQLELLLFKIINSGYIALFVVSGSVKKRFLIDYLSFLNIISVDFLYWKSIGLPYISYIVIH